MASALMAFASVAVSGTLFATGAVCRLGALDDAVIGETGGGKEPREDADVCRKPVAKR